MVWLSSEITIVIRRKHLAQVACFNQHAIQQLVGPERAWRTL
jgi:ribosomal protein L20